MRFTHVHTNTTHDDEAHNPRPRPRHDAYSHDERYARDCDVDVSGSWREEYAAQGVDPSGHELVTDGGRTTFTVPEPGDVVHDRESGHGDDRLFVLGVRERTTARSEYIEEIDATVAEVNPKCSPLAPTATCVYVEEIDAFDPEATLEEIRRAIADGDLRSYTFPVDRLASGSGGDDQ